MELHMILFSNLKEPLSSNWSVGFISEPLVDFEQDPISIDFAEDTPLKELFELKIDKDSIVIEYDHGKFKS